MALKVSRSIFMFRTPVPISLIKCNIWFVPTSVTHIGVCNPSAISSELMISLCEVGDHHHMLFQSPG